MKFSHIGTYLSLVAGTDYNLTSYNIDNHNHALVTNEKMNGRIERIYQVF